MLIQITKAEAQRIDNFNRINFTRWAAQEAHKGWKSEDCPPEFEQVLEESFWELLA